MATFRISKYIYLHKNAPTPQGLASSSIDRDASEWTKYQNSPLELSIDTTPAGGAKISLKYKNTSLEHVDTDEIEERFGSTYGKNNPPFVAICRPPGIGFKYLVRRFHTMTYRFQIKFAYMDEYDRAVEMLSKAGVCIKGSPPKSTRTEGATLTSFKNFNPESQWNGEDDDGDLTQIDPFLQSQTLSPTQPPGPATEPPVMSQTFVDPPSSSQASPPYQFKHSRSARLAPSSSQSYLPVKPTPLSQPRRFSETSTWKRTVDDMPSLGASPVSSPPNSPKRAKSWKKHFTPADTDVRSGNGMVSRGTQTEDPEWLTDTQAMENHIVDVVQNPLFDAYVARIKELMKGDQFEKDGF